MPRLDAMIIMGAQSLSKARFKYEKHSISSICTSSMKSTPGTISALPSSRHSATLVSLCSLTSGLITTTLPGGAGTNTADDEAADDDDADAADDDDEEVAATAVAELVAGIVGVGAAVADTGADTGAVD